MCVRILCVCVYVCASECVSYVMKGHHSLKVGVRGKADGEKESGGEDRGKSGVFFNDPHDQRCHSYLAQNILLNSCI